MAERSAGGVRGEPPHQGGLARAGLTPQQAPRSVGEQFVDPARYGDGLGRGDVLPGRRRGDGLQAQIGGVEVPVGLGGAEFVDPEYLDLAVPGLQGARVVLLELLVPGMEAGQHRLQHRGHVARFGAHHVVGESGRLQDAPHGDRFDPSVVAPHGHLGHHTDQYGAGEHRGAGQSGERRLAPPRGGHRRPVELAHQGRSDPPRHRQHRAGELVVLQVVVRAEALDGGKPHDLAAGQGVGRCEDTPPEPGERPPRGVHQFLAGEQESHVALLVPPHRPAGQGLFALRVDRADPLPVP